MDEAQINLFEPDFNRSIKVQATDQRLTSNAGVILLRDAEHRLGLIDSIAQNILDPRDSRRTRYGIDELIRERVFAMALGYSAQDDLDRFAHDPAFHAAVWNRSGDQVIAERLASQPTQSRLIDIIPSNTANLQTLRSGLAGGIERHILASGGRRVRHATVDIDSFPVEVHGKQHGAQYNGYYRKTVYHPLVASFSVGGDYDGSRVGQRPAEELLAHYRRRGTFKDRLGEFNASIGVHLSSRNFKENEATMLLALLSFNLSSLCRIELEESVGGCWDLTRFQLFLLKVGAEFIKHSRRLIMRIAESTEPLWSRLVQRLQQWSLPETHRISAARRSGFTPPPQHSNLSEVLRW